MAERRCMRRGCWSLHALNKLASMIRWWWWWWWWSFIQGAGRSFFYHVLYSPAESTLLPSREYAILCTVSSPDRPCVCAQDNWLTVVWWWWWWWWYMPVCAPLGAVTSRSPRSLSFKLITSRLWHVSFGNRVESHRHALVFTIITHHAATHGQLARLC